MEENENKFEVISSKISSSDFNKQKPHGFGKSIILPFFSGILGCSLVIGTCFGVPSIKEKILGVDSKPTVQTSIPTGSTTNFVSLSNYSNTTVFAAKKVLPSIVGIEVWSANDIDCNRNWFWYYY